MPAKRFPRALLVFFFLHAVVYGGMPMVQAEASAQIPAAPQHAPPWEAILSGLAAGHPDSLATDAAESRKLTASDAAPDDAFGFAVAVAGDTAVVGAYLDDDGGSGSGSAYVFQRNQGGMNAWGQVKKLTASDAEAGDDFGYTVAISGDTVVVGARQEDSPGYASGAAYVFDRDQGGANNWGQVAKLEASDAGGFDQFGQSVAISGDTVLVGAYEDDDPYSHVTLPDWNSGSAYIFERDEGGAGNWGEVTKLTAADKAQMDKFGVSVAIDADTAVVGAYYHNFGSDDRGAAYVFGRDHGGAGTWGEITKLTASDPADNDLFGDRVAISGDVVLVSAPYKDDDGTNSGAAYFFARNQGGANTWGQTKKVTASDAAAYDYFGRSAAVSGDSAVLGAHFDDDGGSASGSAYVLGRKEGGENNWGEVKKLTASDAVAQDNLGRAASISGNTIVVGSPQDDDGGSNSGSAYVFAGTPRAVAPASPTGTIGDTTPTYTWNAITSDAVGDAAADAATWYYLWVDGPSGNVIKQWFSAAASCAAGTCSATPTTVLADGSYDWWVQTWNDTGYGPWSSGLSFTVSASTPPGAAVLVAPGGTIATSMPTYIWNVAAGSTWYYLWVEGPGGVEIQQWYTEAGALCAVSCAVTPSTMLPDGDHRWWVRTWNAAGLGDWSLRGSFTVDSGPPAATTLVSPTGATTNATPTYTWNALPGSTWYYLWVEGPGGTIIQQWYTSVGAGCAGGTGTCAVTPATSLADGAHKWWIRTWNPSGIGTWSTRLDFTKE